MTESDHPTLSNTAVFTEHLLEALWEEQDEQGLQAGNMEWVDPGALLSNREVSWSGWGCLCHTCSLSASLPAPELPMPLDLPPPPPLDIEDLELPPPPPPGFGSEEPSWVPDAYLEKGT